MRDLHHHIVPQQVLAPAVFTSDQNGAAVDRKGFESVEHLVLLGETGDTLSGSIKIDFKLEESDDGSAWSAVADKEHVIQSTTAPYVAIAAGGIFLTIDDNAEDNTLYRIGYRGNKRYSRVVADFTGTHTNGIEVALVAIKGHPAITPAT